ncbi:hypothetical protein [Thermoclostridium caenicola]|uniref:hypothetical protein n=1 Tax=Thermoclostridium caenicola TaxID=659425 RepID=UPI00122D1227|nr:hypothetical protein [Thermoclostridium caenicola]
MAIKSVSPAPHMQNLIETLGLETKAHYLTLKGRGLSNIFDISGISGRELYNQLFGLHWDLSFTPISNGRTRQLNALKNG